MRLVLTSLLVLLAWMGYAQSTLQVVNRIIEKTMPYLPGQPIQITAQKADILLKGWSQPTVSVQLKLQAKHSDRAVAEREVNYHHYTLDNEGGRITLANQFVIPQRAGKLQSQLKAVYEISLPHQALVRLANSFGDVQVRELVGELVVTLEFGTLRLTNVKGKLHIQSTYGDIEGHKLNANLTVNAQKADITLEELGGTTAIQCQYGHLSVVPAANLLRLSIEAERTDVLITPKRLADFHVKIASLKAPITVPEPVLPYRRQVGHEQFFDYQLGEPKPAITIQNRYGPVVIQGETPLVTK